VSRYQKGKTNLDFTKARDSEWQWHHVGHMLQTDNHASTPTNSVKALKATLPSYKPLNQQNSSDQQQEEKRRGVSTEPLSLRDRHG